MPFQPPALPAALLPLREVRARHVLTSRAEPRRLLRRAKERLLLGLLQGGPRGLRQGGAGQEALLRAKPGSRLAGKYSMGT